MYVGVRTAGATTQMAVYKQFKQKVSSNKKQIVLPWKNSTSSFSLPASRERCEHGQADVGRCFPCLATGKRGHGNHAK